MNSSTHSVHITVTEASHFNERLSEAVDSLIQTATDNRCGILVTRHSTKLYTADVNPNVPLGLTREISLL